MLNREMPGLITDTNADADAVQATYRLGKLEVYNWGPFAGLHRAEFDPHGTAIIGPTGSGKTTLVDALMTLLVHQPRYNLASTGGHESDRTLLSYIRGVLGGDGSDGREEIARPGKTFTGLCATYYSGDESLRLGGLLWTDGPSNAAEDIKRRWLFSQVDDQSLELWLRLLHDDGPRELMRLGRETANLRIFDSKSLYLAHVRQFFDVSENAFTLLNRAAGLKQLNSIDEIFRELVLDDRSAFERALEVAGDFDNLADIHQELEVARRQEESLIPVAGEHDQLLKAQSKESRWQTLKRLIPVWFAINGRERWSQHLEAISMECDKLKSTLKRDQAKEAECVIRVETFRERYLQLGGSVISELQKTIDIQTGLVAEKSKNAKDYQRLVAIFQLDDRLSAVALQRNQAMLAKNGEELQRTRDEQAERQLNAFSNHKEQVNKRDETSLALQKARNRPRSNIHPQFQDFRGELAIQLSLPEDDLPFLAELLEVKSAELGWRGAIERAPPRDQCRRQSPRDRCRNRRLRPRQRKSQPELVDQPTHG